MDCRRCHQKLSMVDIDIHPGCQREEDGEKNPDSRPQVTEFDRGFVKYPWTPPEDAA